MSSTRQLLRAVRRLALPAACVVLPTTCFAGAPAPSASTPAPPASAPGAPPPPPRPAFTACGLASCVPPASTYGEAKRGARLARRLLGVREDAAAAAYAPGATSGNAVPRLWMVMNPGSSSPSSMKLVGAPEDEAGALRHLLVLAALYPDEVAAAIGWEPRRLAAALLGAGGGGSKDDAVPPPLLLRLLAGLHGAAASVGALAGGVQALAAGGWSTATSETGAPWIDSARAAATSVRDVLATLVAAGKALAPEHDPVDAHAASEYTALLAVLRGLLSLSSSRGTALAFSSPGGLQVTVTGTPATGLVTQWTLPEATPRTSKAGAGGLPPLPPGWEWCDAVPGGRLIALGSAATGSVPAPVAPAPPSSSLASPCIARADLDAALLSYEAALCRWAGATPRTAPGASTLALYFYVLALRFQGLLGGVPDAAAQAALAWLKGEGGNDNNNGGGKGGSGDGDDAGGVALPPASAAAVADAARSAWAALRGLQREQRPFSVPPPAWPWRGDAGNGGDGGWGAASSPRGWSEGDDVGAALAAEMERLFGGLLGGWLAGQGSGSSGGWPPNFSGYEEEDDDEEETARRPPAWGAPGGERQRRRVVPAPPRQGAPPQRYLPPAVEDGGAGDSDGLPQPPSAPSGWSPAARAAAEKLLKLGVQLYTPEGRLGPGGLAATPTAPVDWEDLAGAGDIRTAVEDCVLLPLQHRDEYDALVQRTRARPEPNAYGAFLFAGPPGTGKTTAARVLARKLDKPLVVLSFEALGSKFYSETEKRLTDVLAAVAKLEGAVLFVDEAEALFPSRDAAHDTTGGAGVAHKLLSSILRFIEGMEGPGGSATTVVFATNRPSDLDPALLSRCAASVRFPLPSHAQRAAIWARYAKHLPPASLEDLAAASEGMSGRDIRRSAEVVERRFLGKRWRGQEDGSGSSSSAGVEELPPLELYLQACHDRASGDLMDGRRGGTLGNGSTNV